jgi:hypothetical protein
VRSPDAPTMTMICGSGTAGGMAYLLERPADVSPGDARAATW